MASATLILYVSSRAICSLGKATLKCDKPSEKPVKAFKFQVVNREAGKEVALVPLGTSKINSS